MSKRQKVTEACGMLNNDDHNRSVKGMRLDRRDM